MGSEDGTGHMSEIVQTQTLTQRITLHALIVGGSKALPQVAPSPTLSRLAFWQESLCTDDNIGVLHLVPMYQAFKAEIQVHDQLRFVAFGWTAWIFYQKEEPRLKRPKEPLGV